VISISTLKSQAILSFLAMQPECCARRSQLATLWSDRADELARQNLRQCLATLRDELAAAARTAGVVPPPSESGRLSL